MDRRTRNRTCIWLMTIGVLNLTVYTALYAYIGGDAINGRIDDHRPGRQYVVSGHFLHGLAGGEQVYPVQTDERGRYQFAGVRPGDYTLTVNLDGFQPVAQAVTLTSNRPTQRDVVLQLLFSSQVDVSAADCLTHQGGSRHLKRQRREDSDQTHLHADADGGLKSDAQSPGADDGEEDEPRAVANDAGQSHRETDSNDSSGNAWVELEPWTQLQLDGSGAVNKQAQEQD